MVKLIAILLFTLLAAPAAAKDGNTYRRGSVVKSYRTCMKESNFTQARQVLVDAIKKHPEAAADAQLYRYQMDAINELIGQENRKIYLNSKPDTVSYFNYIYQLYSVGLQCDSIEQVSLQAAREAGKKAKSKLRSEVGQMLLPYRNNVLGAGKFHYAKKDYSNAFRYFDLYMQTKSAAVFLDPKGNSILSDPDDNASVAVLAVLSAYASDNHRGVATYLDQSLADQNLRSQLLEVGSKSMAALGDTARMLQLLDDGFDNYPEKDYFLMALTKHYNDHGDYAQALRRAVRMTEVYPLKRDYWYLAGKECLLLSRWNEALAAFGKCVEIQADDAEAHSAIGSIYLQQAHDAYANFNVPLSDPTYTKQKAAINTLYKQSCAAYEKARKFAEDRTDLWLDGLRETYFKLNRGRELRALERKK